MKKCFAAILILLGMHTLSPAQQHVGIGTTAPEALLHMRGTNWTKVLIENAPGQPRGYIGTDQNGTMTFASNAFWTGSAWSYPNTGSSMYMLMHRLNNRFEFRVRPEGGNENTAMVINTAGRVGIGTTAPQQVLSIAGGLNIDQQNLNSGTIANLLSFGGFSGEGIGSKRTEGTGRYGLDFYTSSTQRMHIAGNGNIGIGTNNPQALLDISVGVNRSFRFKNDVIPTLEIASSNANDALAGIMRLRNAVEIFPSSDGTRAGKLDVRNGAGIPTITLNGSTGIIQANSIQASSINATSLIASGGIAGQTIYAPNMPSFAIKNCEVRVVVQGNADPPLNAVLCDITVDVPAPGILQVVGGTDAWFDRWIGNPGGLMELKLDEYTPAGNYMGTLKKRELWNRVYTDPTLETIQEVNGAMQKRYKLVLYKNGQGPGNTIINNHNIKVWFYPNLLNVY